MTTEKTGKGSSDSLEFRTKLGGRIALSARLDSDPGLLKDSSLYKFVWVRQGRVRLEVDHVETALEAGDALPLSPYQHLAFRETAGECLCLLFNSNFYCIFGHDDEVSCNGFLFNGSSHILRLRLRPEECSALDALTETLVGEYAVKDSLQEEMLRTLLKRFIITFTRIARDRYDIRGEKEKAFEIVRKFQVLVGHHFREKKQVRDYADLLARSPKTLSNLFASFGLPSPLHMIHQRIEAEVKRLLLYSDKSAKEIADIVGFEDPPSLSRFFKNRTGESITGYKKRSAGKN